MTDEELERERLWSQHWRMKTAILKETLRIAGRALENAQPIVKAHAVASADEDQFDDLVGEVSRAIDSINRLKL